jgi:hypothetical protein
MINKATRLFTNTNEFTSIYRVVLNYETKSKRNERNETKYYETQRNILKCETKRNETKYTKMRNETKRNEIY